MRLLLLKMASSLSPEVIQRMKVRSDQAETILTQLRNQINLLKAAAVSQSCKGEEDVLRQQNEKLRNEINQIKTQLVMAEIRNGVRQVALPPKRAMSTNAGEGSAAPPQAASPAPEAAAAPAPAKVKKGDKQEKKKPEKKEGEAKGKKGKGAAEAEPDKMDVSRLDLRVGKILSAQKHPDADSLYVEDVDVGEGKTRTVVSGLVKHIPLEQMQNRIAVFMCNLKPAKMRGVLSEGMIMCASAPDKVEILVPPPGVQPGDRVTFDGYPGVPDTQLNPKKKIWETLKPDIRTDNNKVANYKGAPFKVEGKGIVKAPTLADAQIS
ncbi:aminoacyl tRNA synthase complex-interacting multifunctional protein 1-like [Haliotis rufescens]|uniref:aminoacyl tRNA synthase complex-interacting multifunctional protein 1-like n=1 Tax=Haliotis rufescens TaxID=6454 RepID=UPI00201F73A7|nr:aminoacyl tRNA synthase complex-interacting multifunctional protein 1-like [Haliotis rufescens]